ncbi:MAG: glucosamine-1-phosphate N-acetyltransferase [Oscillospiraceae bacterium]|jgi:bifunctional UDP-N-acetylglucosamine pyrophosphorylase/glucosamine-1-phosphate N-acetyltransferase|nr:glucosamine-1-phosphate N-acetyltransferase [Oscillospiraceae bacterium]
MDNKKCIVIFLTEDTARTYDGKPLMLQDVLFCPILNWCMRAWMKKGVRRFFVVCDSASLEEVAACFPEEAAAVAGTAEDYERDIAEFARGCWIEEVREAMLPMGSMMLSFHTIPELVRLQQAAKEEIAMFHQRTGVKVLDVANTYIDPRVTIGAGTVLLPGTILRGETVIGEDCVIGPNAMIADSRIGSGCTVNASQVYESELGRSVQVGPYAHIRPGCRLGDGCRAGAFVEIKNAVFGPGTKMSHLTYVGDAEVGSGVNFGCGTITSNYDGFQKHRTVIGDGAFIGCNTNLVPPVTVGSGAYIAAGTTVTEDVEPDALAISRVRQENKPGWARTNRAIHTGSVQKEQDK